MLVDTDTCRRLKLTVTGTGLTPLLDVLSVLSEDHHSVILEVGNHNIAFAVGLGCFRIVEFSLALIAEEEEKGAGGAELARELLARPLDALDAQAIFERSVPEALRRIGVDPEPAAARPSSPAAA